MDKIGPLLDDLFVALAGSLTPDVGKALNHVVLSIGFMEDERDRLRSAIIEHRSQKADDRCIEDDDRLYEALGDGVKCDRRVGCKEEMLANCKRFIERRCEGGGWPSYRELEKALASARTTLQWYAASHRPEDYLDDNGDRALVWLNGTPRIDETRLVWRDEQPDKPGWWVCAKSHGGMEAMFVTANDIKLVNTTQPQWLGEGKWCMIEKPT